MMMRAAMPHGGKAPVAANPNEQRHARFKKLLKKAEELATKCDVPVAMVFPGVRVKGEPFYWPSKKEATAISARYHALPEKDRKKHSLGQKAPCPENQAAKQQGAGLTRVQEDGIAGALGDMPDEEIRKLLRSVDDSLASASDRIRNLQPRNVDEVDQVLLLEFPDKFMVDSHDDDDSDSQDLHRENAMPPNAAPVSVSTVKNSVTGEDVVMRDKVQGTQPPAAAEAVRSIKEEPKPHTAPPASVNGVPHDGDGIEYVNLGGYMITRDAFEAVWREVGRPVPPPMLEPEWPDSDDDEPLNVWSFYEGPVIELSPARPAP